MSSLIFIHHSSYLWVGDESMILWDYYGVGSVLPLIQEHPHKRLYIMVTHSHHDHFSDIVLTKEYQGHLGGVTYIFHEELRDSVEEEGVHFVRTGGEWSDDRIKVKAYGSTDLGGSFYIEAEGLKLFHAGDLNNWHWNEEALEEYIQVYEEAWSRELSRLTHDIQALDLLMFATDLRLGHDYLKGLREVLSQVEIRWLAPMHLNGTLDPAELQALATEHDFTLLLPRAGEKRNLR